MSAPLAQIGREAGIELKALATPLKEMVIGKTDRVLWLLLATVGAVLLIVCVNLGNLMLARAHGRLRESAIRRALGASGGQVCGPMIIESAVLATAGGALGSPGGLGGASGAHCGGAGRSAAARRGPGGCARAGLCVPGVGGLRDAFRGAAGAADGPVGPTGRAQIQFPYDYGGRRTAAGPQAAGGL